MDGRRSQKRAKGLSGTQSSRVMTKDGAIFAVFHFFGGRAGKGGGGGLWYGSRTEKNGESRITDIKISFS